MSSDYLLIHNFLSLIADGIHLPYPLHLISGLELLRDACLFIQLFYQLKKEIFCSPVNLSNWIKFLIKTNLIIKM